MSEVAASERDRTGHDEVVDAERLTRFVRQVFERSGVPPEDADLLAKYFVWAELHGLSFVGARRITQYVARLREGGTRPALDGPAIVHEQHAFALIDAGHTFAQVTGARAMSLAVDKARSAGVGVVVVRNTTSAGALGYYATLAVDQGMIGMAINNTPPLMSAWGGTVGAIGAQPFAVASPANRHPPLLLDMTNSVMSMVRMHEHQQRGEELPEGVALTVAGKPTVDPAAAMAGILLPSSHRSFGLAVMWEVLTGVLAGADQFGGTVGGFNADKPMGVSLFLMAIDPTVAMPYTTFTGRVDELIDYLHASSPAPGVDRIRVPGERGDAMMRVRRENGIPMSADVITALTDLGVEMGVAW